MIALPTHVTTRWIATLGDEDLIAAEADLYAAFHARERAEKSRAGSRYILLQGPSELVNAWHQWLLVSNETRARGVVVRRRGQARTCRPSVRLPARGAGRPNV